MRSPSWFSKWPFLSCTLALLVLAVQALHADVPTDAEQIRALLRDFAARQKGGLDTSALLPPRLPADQRSKEAGAITGPYTEYEFYEFGQVSLRGDHAELRVRLHSKTPSSEFDKPVTLVFEKEGGSWYFATYDALSFPTLLVVICISASVLYVTICLLYWRHIARRQVPKRLLWEVLILTPVGWALYPAAKPWHRAAVS